MKRFLLFPVLSLVICMLCTACKPEPSTHISADTSTDIPWDKLASVPFSGYICGFEGSTAFVQFPAFLSGQYDVHINGTYRISLLGEDASLNCSGFDIDSIYYDEKSNHTHAYISMYIEFEQAGTFTVDTLVMEINNQRYEKELGKIQITVEQKQPQESPLKATRYFVNIIDLDSMEVQYKNTSEMPVSILALDLPAELFSGQDISRYDSNQFLTESTPTIHGGNSETILFTLQTNPDFFTEDNRYFWFLPYLIYSIDGQQYKTEALPEALMTEKPYTPDYIDALLKKYS